jgi:hypothetical protein
VYDEDLGRVLVFVEQKIELVFVVESILFGM